MNKPIPALSVLHKHGSYKLLPGIAYAVFVCVLIYLGRHAFITYPSPLNPDEVQAGANVLRLMQHGLNWDALDGTTVGPLNTLVLAWPPLLGMDVSLLTIRLTALVLICLTTLGSYFTVAQMGSKYLAAWLTLPLAVFYSFSINPDFQHYSSELLSASLLVASTWALFYFHKAPPCKRISAALLLAGSGLALGSVPFSKIQAAPVAVTIAAFFLYQIIKLSPASERIRHSGAFVIAGLLPATLFLLPLTIAGHFQDFWNSYIIWPTLYVKAPLSVAQLLALITREPLIASMVTASIVALLPAAIGTRRQFSENFHLIFCLATLCAVIFSVMRPGNTFPHYLMFLPPFLPILVAAALPHPTPGSKWARAQNLLVPVIVLAVILPASGQVNGLPDRQPQPLETSTPRILDFLGTQPGDELLIWGWMPQWYLQSGLGPASRESMTNNQLVASPLQSYFKSRLLADVATAKPAYIMDAVAGKSFGFNTPQSQGIASFPELRALVRDRYVAMDGLGKSPLCATTYVRQDRFDGYANRLVRFSAIEASLSLSEEYSAKHLDDFSITEDTCSDFWLLPANQTGYVDLRFLSSEAVDTVWILNTRGGEAMDRGSREVKISLFRQGRTVYESQQRLRAFPYWSQLTLAKPVEADALRVEIVSLTGHGGGLNEVKVLRARTGHTLSTAATVPQ